MLNKNNTETWNLNKIAGFIWFLPILVFIFIIFIGRWSWGLMDDFQLLNQPGNILERFNFFMKGYGNFGEFKPVYVFYVSFFYPLFENFVQFFYVFKLGLAVLSVWIFGHSAYRLTKNKISILFVGIITFSFPYFYDTFVYLSSHEILGLIFTGCAFWVWLNWMDAVDNITVSTPKIWLNWLWVVFFVFLAAFAKETFLVCGIAFAGAMFILAWCSRSKRTGIVFLQSIILFLIFLSYGCLLKFGVQRSYTSHYQLNNFTTIASNLSAWIKKDFIVHIPWLLVMFCFFISNFNFWRSFSKQMLSGIAAGILLYICYLLILLPWVTTSYYAAPLGIFFAFVVAMVLTVIWENISLPFKKCLLAIMFLLNATVCWYVIGRENRYQNDTRLLKQWLIANEKNFRQGSEIPLWTNAMEAGDAIPGFINLDNVIQLRHFAYSSSLESIKNSLQGYYLYSPRFGKIPADSFGQFEKVFSSRNWILLRK
ncbi:MAG: hypothetical protein HQL25_02765 [Candidatus Omnitrophica bacterium]|nr:hypothetical protein [Candidatus Omnitrophota bacterium]